MIYYISDTHFGDERIMRLAMRPFDSVSTMNDYIIQKWNNKVSSRDEVYILGDFAVSDGVALAILQRLNGHKHLIIGNHDRILANALSYFESTCDIKKIIDKGRSVVLCHYPLLSYENSIYGGYQIFGHIHNNTADMATDIQKLLPRSLHAGIDVNDFEPKTLDELIIIKEKQRE